MGVAAPRLLYVKDRAEWRAWLAKHHATLREVWLLYPKRHTGRPRIPYDDAVEEAICHGWIDSIVRRIDDDRYAQKFTPRTNVTKWSAINLRRARRLIRSRRMTRAGRAVIDPRVLSGRISAERRPDPGRVSPPAFMKTALRRNARAWQTFQELPPSQRRNYVLWVSTAKKEETRLRRLREAILLLEAGKPLGLR